MSFASTTDLTKGNPGLGLLRFAVPFMLAFLLQVLYGTVDVIVIGHFGGGSAGVSAVASGSEVMHLVASLIMGVSTGSTVLIGHFFGAKDQKNVNRCIGLTMSLSLLISVAMTAIMVPLAPTIAQLIKTPPEAMEMTVDYASLCSMGIIFIFGYNSLSAIFRGLGNSAAPLIFVAIACVINIIGDLLLVIKFDLGVRGVAISTVTSQALSMLFALVFLNRGNFGFKYKWSNFKLRWGLIGRFVKIGVPSGIQSIIIGLSFMFIFTIVNTMGVTNSAAYGICNKIIGFAFLPAVSFSMALSATTAQNIGAGLHKRAMDTLKLGIAYAIAMGALFLALIQIFPAQFVSLFISRDAASSQGVIMSSVQFIRSFSWEFILVPIVFCCNGFFVGCGKSFFSMANNVLSTFVVRVPAAYFLSRLADATLFEVGFAAPMASLASCIVSIAYLVSGKWKNSDISSDKSDSAAL